MILTPEQIEEWIEKLRSNADDVGPFVGKFFIDKADTIAAYAEIVQAVADIDDMGNDWQRIEDLVLRARRLRGL